MLVVTGTLIVCTATTGICVNDHSCDIGYTVRKEVNMSYEKTLRLNNKLAESDLRIRKCYNGEYIEVDWLAYFYMWESCTRFRYTYENMQNDAFYFLQNLVHSSAIHYWHDRNEDHCFFIQTVNYQLNSSVAEIHLYHVDNYIAGRDPICYCRIKYWKEDKGFLISDHSFITKIY